jgi:hypothetical protein
LCHDIYESGTEADFRLHKSQPKEIAVNTAINRLKIESAGFQRPGYTLIDTCGFKEVYDNLRADLDCLPLQDGEVEVRVFTFEELTNDEVHRVLDKKDVKRGAVIEVILRVLEGLDRQKPWEGASASHLVAFEAANKGKHKYPLFGIGMGYTHSLKRMDMAVFNPYGVPAITRNEDDSTSMSFLRVAGAGFDDVKDVSMLKTGYFLGYR